MLHYIIFFASFTNASEKYCFCVALDQSRCLDGTSQNIVQEKQSDFEPSAQYKKYKNLVSKLHHGWYVCCWGLLSLHPPCSNPEAAQQFRLQPKSRAFCVIHIQPFEISSRQPTSRILPSTLNKTRRRLEDLLRWDDQWTLTLDPALSSQHKFPLVRVR